MKYIENNIEEIKVHFTGIEFGMIDFEISVGNQKFVDRFSEVWDPLSNFKHWMEAIALGVQQTSFTYDDEGNDYTFDFERGRYDKEVFSIRDYYTPERPPLLQAVIDRKQLIAAFYNGFFEFTNSDKFQLKDWEPISLAALLCEELNCTEFELINKILPLKRVELCKLIAITFYNQDALIWHARNFSEGIKLFFDKLSENGNLENYKFKNGNDERFVDIKYDSLSVEKKKECLTEYLQYN